MRLTLVIFSPVLILLLLRSKHYTHTFSLFLDYVSPSVPSYTTSISVDYVLFIFLIIVDII